MTAPDPIRRRLAAELGQPPAAAQALTWQTLATLPTAQEDRASRADLAAAYHNYLVLEDLVSAPPPPAITTTPAALAIATAQALQYPLLTCSLIDQCGRFCHVDYTPVEAPDPDVVICLAAGAAAEAFHAAMRNLQAARVASAGDPAGWYNRVVTAARSLAGPIYNLQATRAEAGFVISWALLCAALARRIGQPPAPRPPVWNGDFPPGY